MNLSASLTQLDFTTKERVKLQMGKSLDVNQDALIDQLIVSVSGQFVRYMGLHALDGAKTEVYELRQHKKVLTLDAKPISVVTSIKHSSRDLGADWAAHGAIDATSYAMSTAGGWVRLLFDPGFDPNYFEVVYTGGLAATTAALVTAFPDLVHAADLQVQYLFSREKKLGGDVSLSDGRATQFGGQYRMLREVEDILDYHRRAQV